MGGACGAHSESQREVHDGFVHYFDLSLSARACRGTKIRGQFEGPRFSLSTMLIPGITLKSSQRKACAFTHWTILPALVLWFYIYIL